jgi:hypothetical protein
MQVRQILTAALLAAAAAGAMAQEIDRSDTLAARNIAGAQAPSASRTRQSVQAETRNLQAQGELKTVGERADAVAVPVVPTTTTASNLTRAQVKADLAQWRSTHKTVVGELG